MGKVGLSVVAIFACGLLAAGALAGSGPLGDLTSSSSTSTETTSTDTGSTHEATTGTTEATGSTEPTPPSPAPPAPASPSIVTFDAGVADSDARVAIAAAGGTVDSSLAVLRMYFASLTADGAAALAADERVARVDADRPREVAGAPDDPRYGEQWALPRIGWDELYGSVAPSGQAEVAILDTGVDTSDPDLDGNVVTGTSILPGGQWNEDPNGHGTAMAGIVAAETNNGGGVAGVGYAGVRVMPVTVLGADGTGQDSDIIEGVVWATQHGADVVLMSFSNPGYSASLQAAIDYAWSQGVVLVAAVGNDATSAPQFPAGDRGVMGVANTDMADGLAGSSNYGQSVFIAAPGQGIATVGGSVSGTSASAAVVAGAAALLKASSVGASNGVIVSRLARTADPAGTTSQTGNGRVNLARAMTDSSNASLQPAGAAPVGGGGPIVGPYVLAARNWVLTFAGTGTGTVKITPNTGTVDAPTSCGGTGSPAATQTVSSTCASNITTSDNGATITFLATPAGSSTFGGWSGVLNASSSTCAGTTNPCSLIFGGNGAITVTFNGAVIRSTATTVTCTPAAVALNQASTCNAVVDDTASGTKSNPTGTVSFARSGAGSGTFSAATCTLANVPSDPDSSQCSVTYTPTAGVNTHSVMATYAGSATHATSNDSDTVTATLRATTTTVTCTPATVALNEASTCNAVVDDTASGTKSNPAGTVSFTRAGSGGGTFSATTCTLADVPSDPDSSQCSVTYTPTSGATVHTVNASYGGASPHAASSDADGFEVTATLRSTSTTVTCTPVTVAFGQGTTCTATVEDTDVGTASFPTGTVGFSTSPAASGTFSSPGTSCTLVQVGATTTSSCAVTYTPSASTGTHTITAAYGGSLTHSSSSDTFDVTVTRRTTATTVTCSPASVALDEGTVCVAVVDDTDAGATSNPSGSVDFTRSGAGTGTFSSPSCTLAPVASDPDSSSCQVGYQPTTGAGAHTVNGAYQGSTTHAISNDDFDVTVTLRSTSTLVTCDSPVAIDEGSTCTATVTDTDGGMKSDPSGSVSFSRTGAGAGSFSAASCAIVSDGSPATFTSSCSVTYTPSAGAGTHTVTGDYGGSLLHDESTDDVDVTVTKRDTQTTVSCTPSTAALDQGTTCTATVDDTDAGLKSNPAGSVTFSQSGGTGAFTGSPCTLTPVASDSDSSSCSVTYTPSAGVTVHTVKGEYGGSAKHEASDDTDDVTVTKRDTQTTVSCTPSTVALDQGTTCTATVDDTDAGTKSNPAGTVTFSRTGAGAGALTGSPCTLDPVASDPDSSSCSVTYTPSAGDNVHTVKGAYGGSVKHDATEDTDAVTVTKRDTVTTVSCTPPTVAIDQSTTCTATVDDTDAGTRSNPAGTVTFSRTGAGAGAFTGSPCTLASVASDPDSSSCSVTYTPSAGDNVHTVKGEYSGSAKHEAGDDTDAVTVTKRSTSTSVSCSPASVVVSQPTTCTATVDDTDAGTKSNPAGTVSFTTSGAGSFTTPGTSCTVAPVAADPDSSRCTVTYTPASGAVATHTITGSYGGSAKHAASFGTADVSVAKRTTTTSIACAPSVQQVGQTMTCTATVKDVDTNGTKSPPQGPVTFAKAVGDSGTFTPGATCTLNTSVVAGDTNTCSVQYSSPTPTVDALSATYNGSAVHKTSATDANAPLFVPVYDPSGGFVTGGGWINSPAGAYPADPTLAGKANFGFVSKYQKGQSTPNGQTEFQFHAGGLNFHSEAYQWLVVSANSTKAQYKGTGEINGVSGYGFMVTAYDGSPDRFRIKIWKVSDSSIVYDNNFGSNDDIDTAPMQIASGSVVIHK